MDEEIAQYRDALLSEIQADAQAGGDYLSTRFIDRVCQVLEAGEEFVEYHVCRGHTTSRRGGHIQIDAYSFSPNDGVLNLIVCDFSGEAAPRPLATDEVRRVAQGGFRFLEGSVHDAIADLWDESHPVHALSREVFSIASSDEMTKACIYVISDRLAGATLGRMPEFSLGTKDVELHLWDVARLARVEASTKGREDIIINFLGEYGCGIPALPAGLDGAARYDSYMCVMPGSILASLYDRFGGRILEQNVRAFLGDNRKVNKGIRDTLRSQPEMFFAFNNGLTVTVSDLNTNIHEFGHTEIIRAKGLQIVNGGQTTASLYWAKKAGVDLSQVYVQMKLSRLPEEGFEDAVHDIARFANAQNAVSASDLFAGHPYFKRLEAISRQTIAPPARPGEVGGFWYFERTTGSYKVELKRKVGLAAKTWQLVNPKKQLLTKTDVARYDTTFEGLPHIVSSGAQKNVAAFGKLITQAWGIDPAMFDVTYFRRLVGRAIITRAVDGAIPAQSWYPGSIVRPLSSYTLALMSSRLQSAGLQPDYDEIWRTQRAPAAFMEEAMRVARLVLPLLMDIPEEQVRNRLVTEWVKKEACWLRVEGSDLELTQDFLATTMPAAAGTRRRPVAWKDRAQQLWRDGTWKRLHDWNRLETRLTAGEAEIVEWAAVASSFAPKGFRLLKLEEAMKHATQEGFV
ncbi:AIPR family protein [Coralloluteibacterium stylophorae]|uniref:AIPR family protein n=1 Tax=Coralloluteibacterium stylophorae TaxID=1776034 RepID=A0A8J7VV54_9GAMM|nr:AIPR family protein [Coralloluteibacterium stylophorae]MBS7456831.1 AIPR family protein [Coralloluteibacterium stylophorae]